MISCPTDLSWSSALGAKRQKLAEAVLGKTVVARIIGFALFLFGTKRETVARTVGFPLDTFLSFLTRMNKVGLGGLRDRRAKVKSLPESEPLRVQVERRGGATVVGFAPRLGEIVLSADNPMQIKVVALTLATNGLLSWQQAADLLGSPSPAYVRTLGRKLAQGDVDGILDQRRGQVRDYRVGEREKGQLIVQWAANAATGKSCSSRTLAADLRQGEVVELPDRTIRHHLKRLGLVGMQNSLSALIDRAKRGFGA